MTRTTTFLAATTACGLAGYAVRRWFAAAAEVEQAPLPTLPPRESAQEVEQRIVDEAAFRILQQLDAADRAMPEVGE